MSISCIHIMDVRQSYSLSQKQFLNYANIGNCIIPKCNFPQLTIILSNIRRSLCLMKLYYFCQCYLIFLMLPVNSDSEISTQFVSFLYYYGYIIIGIFKDRIFQVTSSLLRSIGDQTGPPVLR